MKESQKNSQNELMSVVKRAGFRLTPGLKSVVILLKKNQKPLTVQEIESRLGEKLNVATLYRILEKLELKGIITRIDFFHGHALYELAGSDHHHIVCTSCAQVEELEDCDLKNIESRVLTKSTKFKSISKHSLEFFGLCKQCSR